MQAFDVFQPGEARDPRAVLAQARVVEDQGVCARLGAKAGGDDAAVRSRDQDLACGGVQFRDAVNSDDRNRISVQRWAP